MKITLKQPPQENLLSLLKLAADHTVGERWIYVVTVLSVALEQARELVAEEVPTPAKKRKRKP